MKIFCWRCHVEITPALYCPQCGTGHGPFYNAEKARAYGERLIVGGALRFDPPVEASVIVETYGP